MSNIELSHNDKLIFAEVTAAITDAMIKQYQYLKLKHEEGTLSPDEFAAGINDILKTQSSILHRYAVQVRRGGGSDLGNALEAWSKAISTKSIELSACIDDGRLEDAVKAIIDMGNSLTHNNAATEALERGVGENGATLVRGLGRALGTAATVHTAKEAMDAFFSGDVAEGSAKLTGILVGAVAEVAVDSVVCLAGLPFVVAVVAAGLVAELGMAAESAVKGIAAMCGWEDPKEAKAAVMRQLQVGNDADLHNLGNHLFWGDETADIFIGYDDKPNDMVGMAGDDLLTGAALGDYLNGGVDQDKLEGKGGNDSLVGGAGDDSLIGGWGQIRGRRQLIVRQWRYEPQKMKRSWKDG